MSVTEQRVREIVAEMIEAERQARRAAAAERDRLGVLEMWRAAPEAQVEFWTRGGFALGDYECGILREIGRTDLIPARVAQ